MTHMIYFNKIFRALEFSNLIPLLLVIKLLSFFGNVPLHHILTMLNILLKSLHTVVNIVKIDVGIF